MTTRNVCTRLPGLALTGVVAMATFCAIGCSSVASAISGQGCNGLDRAHSEAQASLGAFADAANNFQLATATVEAKWLSVCNEINADLGLDTSKTTAQDACNVLGAYIHTDLSANGVTIAVSFAADCEASASVQASCQASCAASASCDVSANCTGGDVVGSCSGTCGAQCDVTAPSFACNGTCKGECTATAAVSCSGECTGTCDAPSWSGSCSAGCTANFSGKLWRQLHRHVQREQRERRHLQGHLRGDVRRPGERGVPGGLLGDVLGRHLQREVHRQVQCVDWSHVQRNVQRHLFVHARVGNLQRPVPWGLQRRDDPAIVHRDALVFGRRGMPR